MSSVRLLGVILLVSCIFGAILGSAANAASVTYTGSGAFVLTAGTHELETTGGLLVECKAASGTGQLKSSPATAAELTLTFTGCETLAKKCTSSGQPSGAIQSTKITATFGDINKAKAEVGVVLKPTTGTVFNIATKCGTIDFVLEGSIIESVTPTNTKTKTLTTTAKQSKGLQSLTSFEGESHINTLIAELGGGPERAGVNSENKGTLKEGEAAVLP
jgi:hypothetical protein